MTDRQIVRWIIDTHEGHDFTDKPHDRGGATKFGVTLKLYQQFMQREVSLDEFKALSIDQAIDCLYKVFCYDTKLYALADPLIKLCAVDHAIHAGPARAIESLQFASGVAIDGRWGPVTASAVNKTPRPDLHRKMLAYRQRLLVEIVRTDATQREHVGWWARIANLLDAPRGVLE